MPPGRRRARRIRVELERFVGGWRRMPELDGTVLPILRVPVDRQPDVTVDVVRPDDLVALTFEAYGCALVVGGRDGPVLVAGERGDALLVARFPYQHLAELAIYEQPAPVPDRDTPSNPPVEEGGSGADEGATHRRPLDGVLPARGSRLVFEVPAGHRIPFSSAGLLEAMGELRMRTAALAQPGAQPTEPTSLPGSRLKLPGGWVLEARTAGLVLDRAAAAEVLDTSSVDGIIAGARDRRRARRLLEGDAVSMTMRARRAVERGGSGSGADRGVGRVVGHVLRVPEIRRIPRLRGRAADQLSGPHGELETAIEAPFRLVISPSTELGWRHATEPVAAPSAPDHVELWHTRLAQWVRPPAPDEGSVLDERVQDRRIVRALWARDRDWHPEWVEEGNEPAIGEHQPFRSSLEGADRHLLVRQTAETWMGADGDPIHPAPVAARALWLSGLGAWLDLHGGWQTAGYSARGLPSIMAWDHVAPQGRDQYVRVVYPGFLYPFGHRAALVKVTERKLKTPADPVAGLYQRMFLVVGEPQRRYGEDTHRDLPLTQVRVSPLITPVLDDPRYVEPYVFWPEIGSQRFRFVVDALDHEGRAVRLTMPMLWVGEHVDPDDARDSYNGDDQRDVEAEGQLVAFTPGRRGGESALICRTLTFRAAPSAGGGADDRAPKPALERARVEIPAVERAAPVGPVQVTYDAGYVAQGFGGTANAGEVWARVAGDDGQPPVMRFGEAGAPSDRSGGFVSPSSPVAALSRRIGVAGDPASVASGTFDAAAFFGDAMPKLFGLVKLTDLVDAADSALERAPKIISQQLDRVSGALADLASAKAFIDGLPDELARVVAASAGKPAAAVDAVKQASSSAKVLRPKVLGAIDDFLAAVEAFDAESTEATIAAAVKAPLQALGQAADRLDELVPVLPLAARATLTTTTATMRALAGDARLLLDLVRFAQSLDPSSIEARFSLEWRPTLKSWPEGKPILKVPADGLVVRVDGRASGAGPIGVEVLAELRDFELMLLPQAQLVRIPFERLTFRSGSSGKAEVDVVMQDIEFLGVLAFVQTLKELIPFDGFSDPPNVDVTPAGLTAGFTLGLPAVSIGVFTLANISLNADLQIPFLGKSVTVGFGFCSRERPFTLGVAFLGGGGWFTMRLSPDGLEVLEAGLEAGAVLAIDLGVASGSISAMIGIYLRLEGDEGSLTGYFRLRGEVDVLGLITASIELYLELSYHFKSGKMIGRASITVEVDVLLFSGSVRIECERRFAGSNGDPTFAELMAVRGAKSEPWSEYCSAFAPETIEV